MLVMKVAILTFARTNNYGATLQCYALNKFINELGYDTIILNVPLDDGSVRPKRKRNIFVRGFGFIYRTMKKLFAKSNKKINLQNYEIRYKLSDEEKDLEKKYSKENMKLFDAFRTKYLPNITGEYFDFNDFEKNYPQADAYVVGSDQVWLPNFSLNCFLDFVHRDSVKRIFYAASSGSSSFADFKPKLSITFKNLCCFFSPKKACLDWFLLSL